MGNIVIELPDSEEIQFYSTLFKNPDSETLLARFTLGGYEADFGTGNTQIRTQLQIESLVGMVVGTDIPVPEFEMPSFNPNRKAHELSLEARQRIEEIARHRGAQNPIEGRILYTTERTELFLEGITGKQELIATFQ